MCDPVEVDRARETLQSLLLPGQRKLHWRDEDDRRRKTIVQTLAAIQIGVLVVVRGGLAGEKPERRRRHCLE